MSDKSATLCQRSSRYDVGTLSRRRLIYPQSTEHVDALVRVSSENKGTTTPSQPARVDIDLQRADTLNISRTSSALSAGSLHARQWAENWIRNNYKYTSEPNCTRTVRSFYEEYRRSAEEAGEEVLADRGRNSLGETLKLCFQRDVRSKLRVNGKLEWIYLISPLPVGKSHEQSSTSYQRKASQTCCVLADDSATSGDFSEDGEHCSPFISPVLHALGCSTSTADRRSNSQLTATAQKRSFVPGATSRADLVVIPSDPKEQRAWFEAKKARQHCGGCGYFTTEAACAAHRKFDVRCGKGKFCPRCAEIFVEPDAKRQLQIHLQTCDSVEYLPIKHILPRKQTESPACAESEDEDDAVNERNYIGQLKSFYGADISEDFISAKLQQLRGKVAHQDSRLSKAPNNPLNFTRDFDTPPPTRTQKPHALRQHPLEHDPHGIAPTAVTVRPNGRLAEWLKAERKCELPLTAESLKSMPPALESSKRALEWMAGAGFPQNVIGKDVPLNSDNLTNSKFKKLMR